ncbi:hypothetical protein EK21DRAFT_114206 [Setomelanomma holmii]|uniref:HMG box domain-containing protein n=1 Tax=Setomelanomma holmii TaxID=210430 RepID=A0A9P4H5M7_9PLEO|nr:hypothetical protein EK21DRAFT_114206 [Setomelanomma holmii]
MATTTTKTATPKAATGAGVKKKDGRPAGKKNSNARTAMVKMQTYFKENRSKYKDLDFKEQQKKLGADWKASKENPKNSA